MSHVVIVCVLFFALCIFYYCFCLFQFLNSHFKESDDVFKLTHVITTIRYVALLNTENGLIRTWHGHRIICILCYL